MLGVHVQVNEQEVHRKLKAMYPSSRRRFLLVPLPSLLNVVFATTELLRLVQLEDTNHFLLMNIEDLVVGEQAM